MQTVMENLSQIGQRLINQTPLVGMNVGMLTAAGQQEQVALGSRDGNAAHPVQTDTIYDLASLTKLYTAAAYIQLVRQSDFDLARTIQSVLPQFNYTEITFQQVLQHTSGLPSSVRKTTQLTREMLLTDLYNRELISAPGTEIHYSDVGYMLLGEALKVITGQTLEQAMHQLVFEPLGLHETGYRTPAMPGFYDLPKERFAPTEDVPERGGLLQGTVNDFKAKLLGGAAGHAGIFSTLTDALTFNQFWLEPDVVALLQANRCDFRTLGWHYWRFGGEDKPSIEQDWLYQTGFTGTIMALNLKTNEALTVLTNRVYPERTVYDRWRVDRYQFPQAFFAQ
ncbi:beta-lactamase family protein [Weissella viridescens]|uniref:serine hydrolase domain-containing protein n=1 Tax=Weissella viridescens TaxID=1629 RepID=UPI00174739FE|nr:serine hydrolase domain-containing protein [Weissella viridescens]QOD85744.1 beta-lactamase family protein [Weissella viridescens]